jgi:UDP-N-acetylmuramoylalanine--D-glutamate ligase
MNRNFFTGKKVLVMGLGRFGGGVDAVKFACDAGAKVIITDLASAEQLSDSIKQLEEFADIEYHLGSHDVSDFERADIIVVNPAVPLDNRFVKLARQNNKFITSQIEIFFQLCPATIIGITGANGKSTTAALTAHLLSSGANKNVIASEAKQSQITSRESQVTRYENVWLSGNIGNEPLLTILDRISANDLVVLELSSFQIEQLAQIQKAPKVALLTNLTPNHLDRYGTFTTYCDAKENIFKFQKSDENFPAVSIFNAEDKISTEWFEKYKNNAGRTCIKFSTDDVSEEIGKHFPLPGRANLSNLAAAITVARHFGVKDKQIKKHLSEFKALPHRLELIAEINGVRWYNDSKATTPLSAIAALEAFEQPARCDAVAPRRIIIIAGGYDKNIPFDEMGEKIAQKAKAAILIGQTAGKIAKAIKKKLATSPPTTCGDKEGTEKIIEIKVVDSLDEAVETANTLAVGGDVVLLSPACASYDMFDNFEQRGREFVGLVREISG